MERFAIRCSLGFLGLHLLSCISLYAETYYVSPTGDDTNDGLSIGQAFQTIQKAATEASAGDMVEILAGTYRELPTVARSGTETDPITFRAYNGETVVISAADLVTGWTLANVDFNNDGSTDTDVWQATVNWDANAGSKTSAVLDANTLFVDGEVKFEAREKAENDMLDVNDWGQVPQGRIQTQSNTVRLDDLTGFGNDYWNGAKIYIQNTDWNYETYTITDYNSSNGTLTLDRAFSQVSQKSAHLYYIIGTERALDKAGEWYKDRGTNTLYYKTEPGQNPNALEIEFRRRAYGLNVEGRSHIRVEGITFRGGAIDTNEASDSHVYKGNVFYAYNRGNLGRFELRGDDTIFRENEVKELYGSGIWVMGNGDQIVNNYFHDIGWNPINRVFQFVNASETLVSHNSFIKWSRSVVGTYPLRGVFAYNLVEQGGTTTWDTAVFDSDGQNGTTSFCIIHHNIFRNFSTRGQFEGFYGRNDNQVIHHNLIYDFSGNVTYSGRGTNFRQAYHNTFIGPAPDGTQNARNALITRYNNNLQISVDDISAIGVDMRGNANYTPGDFRDFANRDFHLQPNSSAVDAGIIIDGINDGTNGSGLFLGSAPDAGAIEFDPANPDADNWTSTVGHDFANPPNPTYDWVALPGTNLNDNSSFGIGLGDWTVSAGSPRVGNFNSWNLKGAGDGRYLERTNNSLTGSFNTLSVELEPGEAIQRTFTNLKPNTTYTFGPAIRVINQVIDRGDQFAAQSGTVETGRYREEFFVAGLTPGEWIRYDNVDFGEPGQFDEVEILTSRKDTLTAIDGTVVQMWVDGPDATGGGTLVATFDTPVDDWLWFRQRRSMSGISGLRSVYFNVSGSNAANLAISVTRLLKKDVLEQDKALVTASCSGVTTKERMGESRWADVLSRFTFETCPVTTTATVTVSNPGRSRVYFDQAFLAEGNLIPDDPDNLAFDAGIPEQSSTAAGRNAGLANNGDTVSYSQTTNQANSWWQVSFAQKFSVGQIDLTNIDTSSYGDLSNFTVSVWDGNPESGGIQLWSRSYFDTTGSVARAGTLEIKANDLADDGRIRLASTLGDYVRIQLNGQNNNGNGTLALARVRVVESGSVPQTDNLATAGVASQSSSFRGSWELADWANDGSINVTEIYTTTKNESQAWWQVDLGGESSIGQIVLYNRIGVPERLSNFRVSVWNGDPNSGGSELWGRNYFYNANSAPLSTTTIGEGKGLVINGEITGTNGVRLDDVVGGNFVRVQLNGSNFLSLPEVQVWKQFTAIDDSALTYNYDPGLSAGVFPGAQLLSPSVSGDLSLTGSVTATDRGSGAGNCYNRDFIGGTEPATFNHRIANGRYRITLNMNDASTDLDNMYVVAEGQVVESDIDRPAGTTTTFSVTVDVLDGELNLEFGDADSIDPLWAVNRIVIARMPSSAPGFNPGSNLVTNGQMIEFVNPDSLGTVYYTTDGSDPRLPNGDVNPNAISATSGSTVTTVWQDFDQVTAPSLPLGWSETAVLTSQRWQTSSTYRYAGVNGAFINNTAGTNDANLISPALTLGAAPNKVQFRHSYNAETNWDGGVLEISVNDAAFQDILAAGGSFEEGGYNRTLNGSDNPLGGRQVWSGNSEVFITTRVALPDSAAGQNIRLRWRFGQDNVFSAQRWIVDSIETILTQISDPTYEITSDTTLKVRTLLNGRWSDLSTQSFMLDADTDGLPDTLEQSLYGHPTANADGLGDYDGDGQIDRDEWIAGTSLNDASSVFQVTRFELSTTPSIGVLEWSTVANRRYTLWQSSTLSSGTWTPVLSDLQGTGSDMSYEFPTTDTKIFFRVSVEE